MFSGKRSHRVSLPARIFAFDHQLSYPVMEYTKESRYVLYDDGSFALQYATPAGEYDGMYQQAASGAVTFVSKAPDGVRQRRCRAAS